MTSRDFCYWLQGFFELQDDTTVTLTNGQVNCVRNHLALVFKHEIDPSIGGDAAELQAIHDGGDTPPTKPPTLNYGPGQRC